MSTSGTSPISVIASTPPASTQLANSSNATLGPNAFLTLLTTELQNQDPTSPTDATESVTQLAQFSALQYQQQLADSFSAFQSNFGVLQAASLVGKQATVEVSGANGTSSTTTGTISSIDVQNGTPYFTMTGSNGQTIENTQGQPLLYSLSQIVGIGAGSGTTTTGSTPSGGTTGGN